MNRGALLLVVVLSAACSSSKPPAHWESGGGRLDLLPARWKYKNDDVELRPKGDYAEVLVDGDVEIVIDRVGRVYTKYQQPVAVLEPDGRLVGENQELLGTIGSSFAAMPGKANAWLSITPQGGVTKFDKDGTVKGVGQWFGCSASAFAQQACLLVSYLLFFEDEGERAPNLGPVPVGPITPAGAGLMVTP